MSATIRWEKIVTGSAMPNLSGGMPFTPFYDGSFVGTGRGDDE
jgi:hypothetical protein